MAALLASLIVWFLLGYFFAERPYFWAFVAAFWLVFVGGPSLLACAKYLLRLLGVRLWPTAWLYSAGSRLIPVGVNMTHSVPTVASMAGSSHVEVKQLEIRTDAYVIGHEVLMQFLRTAWARQKQGDDGLSRTYWVESRGALLERGEYEAIIDVLQRAGLVRGRVQGRSGKLIMPAASAIHHLEEHVN